MKPRSLIVLAILIGSLAIPAAVNATTPWPVMDPSDIPGGVGDPPPPPVEPPAPNDEPTDEVPCDTEPVMVMRTM